METIKVNMNPNPLDVQTIHASQNDGEARQWGFKLHNNGDVIDSSELTDQMVFKAYKGGTEQLLPENTSTPVTSPFKGDIKYPQGLLTDQEFTYRQSPTESVGLAKIQTIYGNTLKWNQLINDTGSTTTSNGITFTKNADGSITLNGTATARADYDFERFDYINGHKYLINGIPSGATVDGYRAFLFGVNVILNRIVTATIDDWFMPRIRVSNGVTVSNAVFRLNIFDLTKMFGQGNEPSTLEEFASLFPLSYYDYNQGSLLSFNGTGLKTTGKNQLNPSAFDYDTAYEYSDDGNLTVKVSDPRAWTAVNTFHLKKGNYIFTRSVANGTCDIRFGYENFATSHLIANQVASYSFTVAQDTDVKIKVGYSYSSYPFTTNVMIRFADTDDTFEPYTSSTLSLPISTYFPTGMKSARDVYDELTESKAITRVGSVDLGSLVWNKTSGTTSEYDFFETSSLTPIPTPSGTLNALCPLYKTVNTMTSSSGENKAVRITGSSTIRIRDLSYTDATAFKTAMNGVYLYYELATPTETEFTTASLVTENGEVALANENGVLVGKCNSDISADAGFIEGKIKLSDEDGDVYSNKIQIHVERSPQ